MEDKDCLLLSICEIQSQYAVGAAMGASPPYGGEFGLGFDSGRLVGRSLGLCLTGAKRSRTGAGAKIVKCAKREAEAALERVGHPIKLLFAAPRYLP